MEALGVGLVGAVEDQAGQGNPIPNSAIDLQANIIAECDTTLACYRAAPDAGADPTVVTAWIAEPRAQRHHAQGRSPHRSMKPHFRTSPKTPKPLDRKGGSSRHPHDASSTGTGSAGGRGGWRVLQAVMVDATLAALLADDVDHHTCPVTGDDDRVHARPGHRSSGPHVGRGGAPAHVDRDDSLDPRLAPGFDGYPCPGREQGVRALSEQKVPRPQGLPRACRAQPRRPGRTATPPCPRSTARPTPPRVDARVRAARAPRHHRVSPSGC